MPDKFYDVKVIQIACDKQHVFALDSVGNLYTWGSNEFGALGLGKQTSSRIPERLALAHDIQDIKKIYCFPDCSMILLKDGSLYASGRNNANRLGFGKNVEKVTTFVSLPLNLLTFHFEDFLKFAEKNFFDKKENR